MKKKYYTGNINMVYVKSLVCNKENIDKITLGYRVLKEDVLFYENIFGVTVRLSNDFPMFDLSEAEDFVLNDIKNNGMHAINTSCSYYDFDSFKPVSLSREEEKKLILKRKNKSRD